MILGAYHPARADVLRIATFNTELSRKGPGLLLRDILRGDPQVMAVVKVLSHVAPDVVVIQGFDYDRGLVALSALRDAIARKGLGFAHVFALRPNAGLQSGLDLDGDGRRGRARDAQGYGEFSGQGGMAILSRFPIDVENVRDLSMLLWRDVPGARGPGDRVVLPLDAARVQRLSSVGHWVVPLRLPNETRLTLLTFHATPPVFDGPEDRNGFRNADEARLWSALLDGKLGASPKGAFVLLGDANLDVHDGAGQPAALTSILNDPRLRDPVPKGRGDLMANAEHRGDPALDTVDWPDPAPGNLRVDYVLPSADLAVTGAGVMWPAPDDPLATAVQTASRHRLVWVDVALP
ncbi:endonuclease/exonuclease/phosphatase family protein [Thalassovita taeanensis]|uniref:Endonuclease/Exonuclease/phosphatase family protein n=1 Tax=Thalassovita taeanensis TaxID=657014 RepID=A0A1H9DUL5_9RHOB|nr:Endonuclease/Exonuclease/phosphatase family protein [Thalassovita taeanensis]